MGLKTSQITEQRLWMAVSLGIQRAAFKGFGGDGYRTHSSRNTETNKGPASSWDQASRSIRFSQDPASGSDFG